MKTVGKVKSTIILIVTAVFAVLFGAIIAFAPAANPMGGGCFSTEPANALKATTAAYKVGSGAEFWNSTTATFNQTVYNDLKSKLFGNSEPIAYLQSQPLVFGSRVLDASTINSAVNTDSGMLVRLGGLEWIVTSATLDRNNNVICTLYLAMPYYDTRILFYSGSEYGVRGNNLYCRSDIRKTLNASSNTRFKLFSSGSFATSYLVQPKNVEYQYNENYSELNDGYYAFPGDALGSITNGWYTGDGFTPYTNPTEKFGGVAYNAWGDDYIWLPSVAEVGGFINATADEDDTFKSLSSIWNLSQPQLAQNYYDGGTAIARAWLRSSSSYIETLHLDEACEVLANGCWSENFSCDGSNAGVRPAIHLNLSAVSAAIKSTATSVNNPETVTTTYNGNNQTLKSVYNANNSAVSWYQSNYFEPASNYIELTYYDENGAQIDSSSLTDALDSYWVKAEIKQSWVDSVNKTVESEAKSNGWSDTLTNSVKTARKPKFSGNPQSEEGQPGAESESVRYFKFIIKPREIVVTTPSYNASTGAYTAPRITSTGLPYDAPEVSTRFEGKPSDPTAEAVNTIGSTPPTKRGEYTATAVLVKSAADLTEYTDGNYVIKDATSRRCDVNVGYQKLAVPTVVQASKTYTGSDIEFNLSADYTAAWEEIAEIGELPDGVSKTGSGASLRLVAKNAGTYTITLKIKEDKSYDWCWANNSIQPQTFTITVERKGLHVDFTVAPGGSEFTIKEGSNITFGVLPSDAVADDEVKISLRYYLTDKPDSKVNAANGSLNASGLAQGAYTLEAFLEDSAAPANKNYVLTGTVTQAMTVSAKGIDLSTVTWGYKDNGGAATEISGSTVTVTYTGNPFTFELFQSEATLASKGVKINTANGVNGYVNATQTNATNGAVSVSVRLVPLNAGYAFDDDSEYKDLILSVTVGKATVSFADVTWSDTELEFNALSQQVTISSGFPSFLTPIYSHPNAMNVNDYTTKVSGVSVSNQTLAANYNIPSSSQIAAEETLSHNWSIVKKKLEVTWQSAQQTGSDGTVIFVPCVSDNSVGAIVYTYFNEDKSKEMTLEEIFGEYSQVQTKNYWVCAKLKPAGASGTAYNESNCVLIEGSDDVSATGSFQAFTTGDNKTPVRVGIIKDTAVYNGEAQPVTVDFQGGNLTVENFTVTYKYKDGTELGAGKVPVNAGEYKAVIALDNGQTGQYAITGQCEFDYTIEKFTYDISGMKWVDVQNDNAEYTEAYVYAYKVEHTLSFTGGNVDGLTVVYTSDTEENLSGSNAGKYRVVVSFEVRDTLNYNVPEDVEFIWEILPYTPDLSAVTWNYNTDSSFEFSIVDGTPVKYSVFLNGIPEGMKELIVYGGDTGEYSDAESHVTTFAIDETNPNRGNYGDLVFAGGLSDRLVWEIKPLVIDKASAKQTKPFDVDGYSFNQITNLPDDFAEYFDVQVLDKIGESVPQTDGSWHFVDVERYRILIQFKYGMNRSNGGTKDNVKWSDNGRGSYQIALTIEQLVLNAEGWIDGTENSRPELDSNEIETVEKYFDYVLKLYETGENLEINTILKYETYYTISLQLKEGFEGNVAINYKGQATEVTAPYMFRTGTDPLADPPENFYEKPTGDDLIIGVRHTGKEITFEFTVDWFDEEVMEAIGTMKGTDVGEYPVMVGFKPGSLAAWGTEDDYDVSAITVTFVIYEDDTYGKFILKDTAKKNAFKFQYEDFSELEGDIKDYVYGADNVVYMTKLTCEDTLADLLAQFKNEDIKVYGEAGTPITDMTATLATGMILRLEDGGTVLNQLTISVLGDVDGDGDITTVDKAQLNAYSLGTLDLAGAKLLAGDIDDDGDITTVDKAQLNAYTLGSFDIYENLILKTATAQALSVEAEEGSEADDVVVTLALSEEVTVKSEEVRKDISEEEPAERTPADKAEAVTDTRRLRLYF